MVSSTNTSAVLSGSLCIVDVTTPSGRNKSAADDDIMQYMKQALSDDDVIASLASKIADIVANKIGDRLDLLEKTMIEKDKRIDKLKQALDELEQYSRRSPVRVSGIHEKARGDQLDTIVTTLFNDMDVPLTLNNVNRTHRIDHKQKSLPTSNHPNQVHDSQEASQRQTANCLHLGRSDPEKS